ncbi:alpha/beta fold hydrolase [Sphingomonas sp.]|uniref:alpha/beta fold hydrolase n=1 Tax=Sphingomonas sp. TaxID=28214 RepID=UPI0025E93B8F|nr:alpha/beta fold hydrolase [Sphingomonas sp.]
MTSVPDLPFSHFASFDGVELAWRETGAGRPVILLHGLFSSAYVNWIKFGTAALIAEAGFRVIMPDLRCHGNSDAPHDPALYSAHVLARDAEALVARLGLAEFDLGGFSLGSRTTVRTVLRGMTPRRIVLGGMGLEGLAGWRNRKRFFLDAIALADTATRGDPHWLSIQFMKTMKIDPVAATLLLATFADTDPAELTGITMPTLLVCGVDDHDNGSAPALQAALPDARLATVPGTHMSSVTSPLMGAAIASFLSA